MGKKKSSKVMIKNEDSNKTIKEISQKTRKSKEQRKQEKIQKRFERYSGNNVYGKYKNTGIYRPYQRSLDRNVSQKRYYKNIYFEFLALFSNFEFVIKQP